MSEPTIADLRARLEAITDDTTLPKSHPVWVLLVAIEALNGIEGPSNEVRVVNREHAPLIWWLLDDLVSAAEFTAKAHIKIVDQAIQIEAWRNSASVLSQMLRLITEKGKVSLTGKAGAARRAAIEFVAKRSGRTDVLGVQQEGTSALYPWAHKRGVRAAFGDGFHDVAETRPL